MSLRTATFVGAATLICAGGISMPSAAAVTAPDRLTVTVLDSAGTTSTTRLTCHPAGGTHPKPRIACRQLHAMSKPFAPLPADVMCTQIYGGPETATVTGVWNGRRVSMTFSRTDGCRIAQWDAYSYLLGAAPGAGSGAQPNPS
jgi:hypothetical protein